jgi:hypothetical protein
LEVVEGEGRVLLLHSRWGESAVRTEYQSATLLIELVDLSDGDSQAIELDQAGIGQYREGGQILVYDSQMMRGSVTQVATEEDEAEIALDIVTAAPTVDLNHFGSVGIRGTIEAERVQSIQDCY